MRIGITVEDRNEIKPLFSFLILAASLLAGLVVMGVIFAAAGKDPVMGIFRIFRSGFFSSYGIAETFSRALPLMLVGTGLAVAFRGKFWNIGAEGQLLGGAMAATWVGLNCAFLPSWVLLPLMFFAGFVGGAAWGVLAAALKVFFSVNETISTLMLNYVLAEFVRFLIVGPWKGESQRGFPYTDNLAEHATLATIPGTTIPYATIVIALVSIAIVYILMYRTKFGYEVRVLGENADAARYAGIDAARVTILIMLVSGGLAGIAGFNEIAANHKHMTYPDTISANYGFTGIIVAWLARLDPRWVIFSSIFFAGIVVGGNSIQISMGLPAATVQVFNGVILVFLIMSEYFMKNRLRVSILNGGDHA
ncbi:MAG: ABC transporter permease [Treponemataceae bacterium]